MNSFAARLALLIAVLLTGQTARADDEARRPNVILIMTDDQGHGDLGFHGNPQIKTPTLDRLARQSVRWRRFYVSPVCSPTRSSLLTGRYNYRTGVVDTYIGRSMMHSAEGTLAELLSGAGYRTGIFGKWHLGDNYPMRPQDQGFEECLVHGGGGIAQPADPPGNSYFDPKLQHNGQTVQTEGYCSDVFTDAAIDYISDHADEPFFVYLAFNCPHSPLQVSDEYLQPYREMDLSHDAFPSFGQPLTGRPKIDDTARVYAMVTNIDDNLARLFARLDELQLTDDTIVIFLTDNGPQQVRYNSGMRGRKGSVYEGGIRVPCFMRWPRGLPADVDIDQAAAHIDIVPTLLAACDVPLPTDVAFDGRNLLPLLSDETAEWPPRTLFFQWHRGDVPQPFRACTAVGERWKLVQADGVQPDSSFDADQFELFDLLADPYEQHNLAQENPAEVERLREAYASWFADVSSSRGFNPPRIQLGTPHESPTTLTRQDWRGPEAGWAPRDLGYWEVDVVGEGGYDVRLRFDPAKKVEQAVVQMGSDRQSQELSPNEAETTFHFESLPQGPQRLEAWLEADSDKRGVNYVDVTWLGSEPASP